jgi:glycine/D-amino acid oxidase-like deaminating enzyme
MIKNERDLIIIGGGVTGAILAYLAAKAGARVILFRISDKNRPFADTLRNHGWMQSGLLYAVSIPREAARMRRWGKLMLDMFNVIPLPGPGIFRMASEARAEKFLQEAARLNIRVELYSEAEAQEIVGAVHESGSFNFAVPDRPFNPADLVDSALIRAEMEGAEIIDLDPGCPVELVRESSEPNGFIVRVGDNLYGAGATVICAGAGTPRLLEQVGAEHRIRVFRSTLLSALDLNLCSASLLVDLDTGLSLVRHPSQVMPGLYHDVIGARNRVLLTSHEAAHRVVTQTEIDDLLRLLPAAYREAIEREGFKVNAGHKTEALNEKDEPTAAPYVEEVKAVGIRQLFVGLPGKATMGLWTAKSLMDLLRLPHSLGPDEEEPKGAARAGHQPNTNGTEQYPKLMHWDYPGEDKREGQNDEGDESIQDGNSEYEN